MASWVSVLSNRDGAGHAALAICHEHPVKTRYEVFHVIAQRGVAAIERMRVVRVHDGGFKVRSVGGDNVLHAKLDDLEPLPGPDWYRDPCVSGGDAWSLTGWDETPRLQITAGQAEDLMGRCFSECALRLQSRFSFRFLPTKGPFVEQTKRFNFYASMAIVPNVRVGNAVLGENCVSWVYNTLRASGITFSWTFYVCSFISPRLAVANGNLRPSFLGNKYW